ncbi:hypothetical protein K2173_016368 [Erythroxylum novogranatense]|uniref:Uncharacterized protein n=1 Tax=Erythroxylum novogranatense TaxID=1862640 RepID=A0AAV8SG61_9ROSI|nr:hypothetical protein K2173_016368 [Erythroxylum novogranatense]
MAGRHHLPPNSSKLREAVPPSRLAAEDHRRHHHHHPSIVLEDRISIQHREIQTLLHDNQRLAATHVALEQELALAQQDLRQLSAVSVGVKAEKDAQVRELLEKSLKLEADGRVIDTMSAELVQVRADVKKLAMQRQELTADLQAVNTDLDKAKKEAEPIPAIMSEIESLRRENQRGRAAIEREKRTRSINLQHRQTMEKNMSLLSHEIERLHTELGGSEKRARDAAGVAVAANPVMLGSGYVMSYGNNETGCIGSLYPVAYGVHQVLPISLPVPGNTDAGAQFITGVMPTNSYDMQQKPL